jgi:processive 1,2-diacylglycerol beta-glucosyltransferase
MKNKKKVIIFTSSGGGGHLSATAALEHHLGQNYNVEPVHIFKLLSHLDPIRVITFNKYSCEELFNELLPKKYCKLIAFISRLGTQYIHRRRKKIRQDLRDYFIQYKPALIISIVPIMNYIILDIAQELNIPFILIPTDLNVTIYIQRIKKPTYKQFYIGLSFDNKEIMKPIKKAHIPDEHVFILGAPLKADFFVHKNKKILKETYNIDDHKPIIMVLMGARGSSETEKYTKQLLNIKTPVQLIVCVGKNHKSKEKIEQFTVPSHISMTIVEFTEHIADYMTMADILISKSGSQSVCEALYTNTPILLDATSALLPWEKFNHTFIKKHRFGDRIKKYKQIVPLVSSLLKHPEKLRTYKHNLEKLKKKDFEDELHKLLHKIFA